MNRKTVFLFLSKMDFGGQERFVSRLSKILEEKYKVYIVLFDASVVNYDIYCDIVDLNCKNFNGGIFNKIGKTLIRVYRLSQAIKKYNPDVCFSFGEGPNLINVLCKRKRVKTLISIRGFASAERAMSKKIIKWLYGRADEIICVSKGIADYLSDNYSFFRPRLSVLYNGYDAKDIFEQSKVMSDDNLIVEGERSFISVGTLRPEKGYWHLIKAFSLLVKSGYDSCLYIVGSDYLDNGIKLKQLAIDLKIQDNVLFFPWTKNPFKYIADADVYVLSSVREGFPNALVEAMACKKAVIAADCKTGPAEILIDNWDGESVADVKFTEYGVLVPELELAEDYSTRVTDGERKLAKAMETILNDKGLREKYECKSYERANYFSYSNCLDDFEAILEDLSEYY